MDGADLASETLFAELYRAKDARAGRLALALDLFAASEEIMRQNLTRQHQGAPASLIERLLDEWLQREAPVASAP